MGHIKNRTKTPKDPPGVLLGASKSFLKLWFPDSFSEAFSDKNEGSFCVQIYQPRALGSKTIFWYTATPQTTAGFFKWTMIILKLYVELRMVFDQASEEIQLEAAILLSPECSVGFQLRVISMRLKAVFFWEAYDRFWAFGGLKTG